ncbi:MAG: hypothetical protein K9G62_01120 [Alphaproteobacteria bacterium]|nr:hypothetical protein [Alphaproteobacteria bacterium]
MKKSLIAGFGEKSLAAPSLPINPEDIPMDLETERFFIAEFIADLRQKKEEGCPLIYTCSCGQCIGKLTMADLYGQALAGVGHGKKLTEDYLFFIKDYARDQNLSPKELAERQKAENQVLKISGNSDKVRTLE